MLLYELARLNRFNQSLAFPDKPGPSVFLSVPTCPSFLRRKGPLQVEGRGLLCPSVLPGRGVSSEERRPDRQDIRPQELDFLWEPTVPLVAPSPGGGPAPISKSFL